MGDEHRLLLHLLKYYDRSVRPVFNASSVVTVAIGLTLTHIFNIDEKSQVLSMNVWLEQEWIDERIFWDPENYAGIKQLTVPTRFVWTPDIVLYNNAEDFSQGLVQTNVAIYPDGKILWAPPVKYRSVCQLDVTFFPFDEQICRLRFGSWIYDGSQVNVVNRSREISLDSYTDHGEWQILETEVKRNMSPYAFDPNVLYPELTFILYLRRRTLFYMYNIIIPCIMLSCLTMGQFWLPCESGEKVTLGLTVVLAYSVFSFNIAENMPETSEVVPLIAMYMITVMSISSAAVGLSVIVLNVRHGTGPRQQVPPWMLYLADQLLAKLLRLEQPNLEECKVKVDQDVSVNRAFQALSTYIIAVASNTDEPEYSPSPPPPHDSQTSLSWDIVKEQGNRVKFAPDVADSFLKPTTRRPSRRLSSAFQGEVANSKVRNIIERTSVLMERFEAENRNEDTVAEWQRVARIFDQFFFLIVFILTLVCTTLMLSVGFLSRK